MESFFAIRQVFRKCCNPIYYETVQILTPQERTFLHPRRRIAATNYLVFCLSEIISVIVTVLARGVKQGDGEMADVVVSMMK